MNTGAKIKEYRKRAKLTQENLADLIRVNRVTITKYENGSINPPLKKLEEIAKVLNCSVFDLISKEAFEEASPEEKNILIDIAFNDANETINKAMQICQLAGYQWKWNSAKDGLIHLINNKTGIEYAVSDEDFTSAVNGSRDFIEFNFEKLIRSAKIITDGK